MEKISTDIYTFSELRKNGFTYVDKTAVLLPLVDMSVGKQFFIARPRRFGKSLLVSTIRSIFEGRRDLFKGLAIDSSDYDWKTYPVIHLDMGSCQADTVEGLWDKLHVLLLREAERHGVAMRENASVPSQFTLLIDDVIAAADRRAKAGDPAASVEQVWLLPLMVQTGYLTIKSSEQQGDAVVCELGYPNREVAEAMSQHLTLGFSELSKGEFSSVCTRARCITRR